MTSLNRLRRGRGTVAALTLLSSVSLAAVFPAFAQVSDKELVVVTGNAPGALDPSRIAAASSGVMAMIAETLVDMNSESQIVPLLASEWSKSEDGLTWAFKLREGVSFTDGQPFNAAAVKANWDRLLLDPDRTCLNCAQLKQFAAGAEVLGEYEVALKLKSPLADRVVLGLLTTGPYSIVSPATIAKDAPGYAELSTIVGTAPYVLTENVSGDRAVFPRNDAYWGEKPYFKTQRYRIVTEGATREADVLAGTAHIAFAPPISDLAMLQSNPDVKTVLAPSNRTLMMYPNVVSDRQPLLRDPRVRKALNLAVNVEAIVQSLLFGAGTVADAPFSATDLGYCKAGDNVYDPEAAKALLKEAGAEGMVVEMISPAGRYLQDSQVAAVVANDLRQVGVVVNGPRTMDFPTYLTHLQAPPADSEWDLALAGLGATYMDVGASAPAYYTGSIAPKGINSAGYSNPEVDRLYEEAAAEGDPEKRAAMYCQMGKILWEDSAALYLYQQRVPIVTVNNVEGVITIPNEKIVTTYVREVE